MIIFERDHKTNFVDRNNVFVGFDSEQHCCEKFGYCLSYFEPNDKNYNDNESEIMLSLDQYDFDRNYFKEIYGENNDEWAGVVFRLTNSYNSEIFLILYNAHNGYYSHGFHMDVGGIQLRSGRL